LDASVEAVLTVNAFEDDAAQAIVKALLESDPGRPHMAVRTHGGFTVLRET
jgi:hypothetical protein